MLTDFLYALETVFREEERDLTDLCRELEGNAFVGFMPAIKLDLWPIYTLGCTHASRFTGANSLHKVYFMPIDVCDRAIYPSLARLVRGFYTGKKEPEAQKEDFSLRGLFSGRKNGSELPDSMCGITVGEIIPLSFSSLEVKIPLRLNSKAECDGIYLRLMLPNNSEAHLFALCGTPEKIWREVIEKYEIHTEMVIHSSKGFGHWFNLTPFYKYLTVTKKPHLLPRFYFKGRYISENDAPELSVAEETIEDDARYGDSIIYRLPERLT
ncbi:MAG: hypothetical protein ACI3XI_08900 [Eubacteriales bacterium]